MNGESLVHHVREPAGAPEGALILLHGRGTDETDLYPLLDELDPERKLVGVTPGAPLTDVPPGGRHWYIVEEVGQPHEETFLSTIETLSRWCDDFVRSRGVSWEKTIVGGFSQGAAMAHSITFGDGRPAPAGMMAMSGFLPTVRGWRLDPRGHRQVPVWISHGSFDNVIPVGFGRRARDVLEQAGVHVIFRESRVLHSIDPELLPEMREFIDYALTPEEERGRGIVV